MPAVLKNKSKKRLKKTEEAPDHLGTKFLLSSHSI
jgi:hypothetical protein